jgi:hypothetical protein
LSPSSQPKTRPVLAESTGFNKKLWPWLVLTTLISMGLGLFLAGTWQDPLSYLATFQADLGPVIKLLLISSAALFPLVVPAIVTSAPRAGLLQASFSGLGTFVGWSLKGSLSLWLGIGLGVFLTLITLGFLRSVRTRAAKFVAPYLKEILKPSARLFLGELIFSILLVSFLAMKAQASEGGFRIPEPIIRGILKPSVKILNQQLSQQLTSQLGDRFEATIGTRDQEEIAEFIKAELVEATQEGGVRQAFGFRADKLNLEKITITPEGEIDLWPAVEASLPEIARELDQELVEYRWLLVLGFIFLQGLVLLSLLWLGAPILTLFLVVEIKILTSLGYLKEREETVSVIRLTLS